jgi:hypothetical protein
MRIQENHSHPVLLVSSVLTQAVSQLKVQEMFVYYLDQNHQLLWKVRHAKESTSKLLDHSHHALKVSAVRLLVV